VAAAGTSEADVRAEIKAIMAANPQAMKAPKPMQALMGLVMAKLRGRAPGALIMRVLKEELEN